MEKNILMELGIIAHMRAVEVSISLLIHVSASVDVALVAEAVALWPSEFGQSPHKLSEGVAGALATADAKGRMRV